MSHCQMQWVKCKSKYLFKNLNVTADKGWELIIKEPTSEKPVSNQGKNQS